MNPVLGRLGAENTRDFLEENAGNKPSIQVALRCPSCLASAFEARQVDLIPYDVPEASAPTMVGIIFVRIPVNG